MKLAQSPSLAKETVYIVISRILAVVDASLIPGGLLGAAEYKDLQTILLRTAGLFFSTILLSFRRSGVGLAA